MSVSLRFSLPNRSGLATVILAFTGLVVLSGCDDTYSKDMVYRKRTDPIIVSEVTMEVGYEPDRPGQLPLFRLTELDDARNPFNPYRDKFLAAYADPTQLTGAQRDELENILSSCFGRPASPTVDVTLVNGPKEEMKRLEEVIAKKLKLSPPMLEEGSRLYRLHCLQCHGLTGDGRGPTSKWVNPHPRDYRPGIFKFVSVSPTEEGKPRRPRRADLLRTLRQGVEGTSMPSFNMLPEPELEALVSYVIHLSMRGQVELEGLLKLYKDQESANIQRFLFRRSPQTGKVKFVEFIDAWGTSQDPSFVIEPGPYKIDPKADPEEMAKSVRRGHELFRSTKAECLKCHLDYGRGPQFKVDEWGTMVRPANLTTGVYRGGRRPIDLYWRIHAGINGSGMTPFGVGANKLNSDQIWDLVNFLEVLPYSAMRAKYNIELN
jgi:mono/diheme cytochrome c family protein